MREPALMKEKIVLVTGFAPFEGFAVNSSWQGVEGLPGQIGGFRLQKLLLPVSFRGAWPAVEKAIRELRPEIVICTGLAAKRECLSVERAAINVNDARIADNDDFQPIDRVIDYSAPNAYFTGLPMRRIIDRIAAGGISASLSDSAGTYVCNDVMFRLMHLIANEMPEIMGGFIHVPATPEMLMNSAMLQAGAGRVAGLALPEIIRGLQVAIETCVELIETGQWHGVRRLIKNYDPHWPEEFVAICDRLAAGLGPLALRIDHIGSTSVPGLAAKDIIDVQITVRALDEELLAAMTAIGFTRSEIAVADHVPPGQTADPEQWRKWFFKPPTGHRPTNVHVRVVGRANQRYPLLFRDFLRAHPDYACAYGRLKERLAGNLANARMYPEVKDPAVDLIYFAAEKWATETSWRA